jgi:hypothetical protein
LGNLSNTCPGRLSPADEATSSLCCTLQQGFIQVDGEVLNCDTNIYVADIIAANGVSHAIYGVLLPAN